MDEHNVTTKFAADSVPAEQKERLHEVANELLNIYQTLVDMRYVDPEGLIRGPHELSEKLLTCYAQCELDPAIIYLYSIMPYIDGAETDAEDFFQGGAFFNQLSIRDVERGRDPRYLSPKGGFDDEEGQYMYPWYTPLSNCGNHSPIIIYDAKEHRIWIVDQIDGCTTDPVYRKGWYGESESEKDEASNWGDSGSSDWSGDGGSEEEMNFSDGASEGSSEFWNDEDDIGETREIDTMIEDQAEVIEYDEGFEHVEELEEWEREEAAAVNNRNSLEPIRSRPAGDVLRDINCLYRALKELPGQGEYSGWMEPAILKPLYLKNGWLDEFNGEQFEIDVARAYATERARYFAEEPLRQVKCYAGWAERAGTDIERYTKKNAEAQTPGDEWTTRFELWKAEERSERNARDLKMAKEKAEKLCPNGVCQKEEDLPLWQVEQLRVETQGKRESAQRNDHVTFAEQFKDNPERIRHMEGRHRRAQKQWAVYEEAFVASKFDAEHLRPGVTFQEATGIKSLGREDTLSSIASQKNVIEYLERYVQSVRDFAKTVPQNALAGIAAVEIEIQRNEKSLTDSRKRLKGSEKWLAEHGNTD
ncbi:hypothetical protein P171DRAFT_430277 [Karstenula rhodostoma CBS 690.94]|uniref:Uncharacterized protein n=1 Tax=Karstenula rhodostoma CBS 690.94 TaxID=1392251 RepID=A0A9P4PL44_9PLEO|nr:hypothetical protein P171DRAFT_430277 [Karstenula rhodostoma CBS 690.94]